MTCGVGRCPLRWRRDPRRIRRRLVRGPRSRSRRLPARVRVGCARLLPRRQGTLRALAALRGRGPPPLRGGARGDVHLPPPVLAARRLAGPPRAGQSPDPVHVELPAAVDRARRRGRRAAPGARGHEPHRKRISYSLWRRLHYLNFAVWIAATAHGLGAGSDSRSPAFLLMYALTAGIIGMLALRRF